LQETGTSTLPNIYLPSIGQTQDPFEEAFKITHPIEPRNIFTNNTVASQPMASLMLSRTSTFAAQKSQESPYFPIIPEPPVNEIEQNTKSTNSLTEYETLDKIEPQEAPAER